MKQNQKLKNVLDWRKASGPIDYPLTNDYMFRMVLQSNEAALRGLIGALLHIPQRAIREVVIENPIAPGEGFDSKTFILDIRVRMNDDTVINLEMQVKNFHNWPNRSLSYLCRNFDSLQKGEDYESASAVIHISLLDFDLFPQRPEFYARYRMMNVRTHEIYNDKFALNVLSLRRAEVATEEDQDWHIVEWAGLFRAGTWEELKMLAEHSEVYAGVASSLYYQNSDQIVREMCEAREEALRHEERMQKKLAETEEARLEAQRHKERMQKKLAETEEARLEAQNRLTEAEEARLEAQRHEEHMQKKLAETEEARLQTQNRLSETEEELRRLKSELAALRADKEARKGTEA